MKHKRSTSRFLALMICLTMVLTPLAAYAAEAEAADQQNAAQITESVEADIEESLPDSEEASIDDAVIDEDADGDIEAEPESYEDEGGEEAEPQDAEPAEAEDAEEVDVIDDEDAGEAADAGNTDYEISDPDLEPEDPQPAEEDGEIIEEIVDIPSVEIPALADVVNASAPTKVWVESSDTSKIPMPIEGFRQSGRSTYELYLPGGVNVSDCYLCWDGGSQVTLNGVNYLSGSCPIPSVSKSYDANRVTYSFNNGSQTLASFPVVTYQGSASVKQFFIEIDPTTTGVTAADMEGDKNKEGKGTIYIDGVKYGLDKMKGRGNVTWSDAKDKKPFNVTVDTKITLGLNVEATKKWTILAEITDHSLMCNRLGLYLGEKLGVGYAATSADVWMNGEYQGCYTVTPKTDAYVTKDGYMIENDNYKEPEGGDHQFALEGLNGVNKNDPWNQPWSSAYNLITVKEMGSNLPKIYGSEDQAYTAMENWLQEAWNAIRYGRNYTDYIDEESFAKIYLIEEFIRQYDICAGSLLFHRDGDGSGDKLYAGPIWDCDNAFGSTNSTFGSSPDLRTAKGNFIQSIDENSRRTCLYKTIYSVNPNFQTAVKVQYNRNRSTFNNLANKLDEIKNEIQDSAMMNHFKVINLGDYGNHYFGNNTTLEQYDNTYRQEYKKTATDDSSAKSNWSTYVDNLRTYVTVRTKWFQNTYYDSSIVDPADCNHQFEQTGEVQPTCTKDGSITQTCRICHTVETETVPMLGHDFDLDNAVCRRCGEKIPKATFDCSPGLTVTVLYTKDFSGEIEEDASFAFPRENKKGAIDISGDGQVNFVVGPKEGYTFDGDVSVTAAPATSYKNLKGEDETGIPNGWRATKVTDDFTITVSADLDAIVTFDADNGSEPTTQEIRINGYAAKPRDPVKNGFTFEGWYKVGPDGSLADEAFNFRTQITEPITLKAKWKATGAVIQSANVDFNGQIHLVFTFDFPDWIKQTSGAYVSMVKYGKEVKTVNTPISDGASGGTVFTLPVMIPEFADTVNVTVCDSSGNKLPLYSSKGTDYTDGFEYSVKTYAEKKAADDNASEAMKHLAEALFDYGTASQIHFQYQDYSGLSVDSHVTSVTLEDIAPYKASVVSSTKPAGFTGASIMTFFESDNTLRILFSLESGRDPADYTFTFDDGSANAPKTVTPVKREIDGKIYYCVDVKNIAAPNLDKLYTFSISDGSATYTINARAMSYAYTSVKNGLESRKNLGKAFFLYNQAANEFFGISTN